MESRRCKSSGVFAANEEKTFVNTVPPKDTSVNCWNVFGILAERNVKVRP